MREVLSRGPVRLVLQLLFSGLILLLLVHDVDWSGVLRTLEQGSIKWLIAALLFKTLSLIVHETRLWLALPRPR